MRLLLLFAVLSNSILFAQDYWQQEVNYKIEVRLDDVNNFLHGNETFEYINNSPEALDKIYIHLWANAYKDGESALAKQQYNNGNDQLKYGSDSIKGFIDSLDFKVNGVKTNWYFEEFNDDIAIIELSTPLNSGESLMINTPFRVKIPNGSISRLGHVGESFQITQWYPKPAVYDKDGWHQMPYLNQGEFYSEFGSFDVSITLPKNYVVGSTGDLQTQSEIDFLNEKAALTELAIQSGYNYVSFEDEKKENGFPASSSEYKTIRYTQKNVHDFAWFADKRYTVLKGEVKLPHSGRTVTTWAMYTPRESKLWVKSLEYLHDAIYYYSLWNGDYPYNNVTAVDGTISAGGGMEYPNVTVIGGSGNDYQLEVVIVHEVGHNWFYGQLGTNERVHGWMDEGMNTLNEVRYMQTKYPKNKALSDMMFNGVMHFNDLSHHDMADLSYRMFTALGMDQPIETHSACFTSANYGAVMYMKTGLVFFYLKAYLGEELFDKSMQAYYEEWEFKHPQPEDMQRSLEKASGKNLSWLFKDLIQTTNQIDYKIKRVKETENGYLVKVKTKGNVDGPIIVNGMYQDSIVTTTIIEPGNKINEIEINGVQIDEVRIDKNKDIPELNRQNNTWADNKLFKKFEPIKVEFLIGDDEAEATNIFWTPVVAGNTYDQFMLGLAVHNNGIPFSKFSYTIAPMYSFGRKMVSGVAELSYTLHPKDYLMYSRFGMSVKSFKHDTIYRDNDSYFISVAPYWKGKIGNRKNQNKAYSQTILVQTIYKKDKYGPTHIEHAGGYVEYNFDYKKPDHKLNIQVRNEFITNVNNTDQMGRVTLSSTYNYRYKKRGQESWIQLRGFIGQQYIRDYDASVNGYQYGMSLSGRDGRQDLFVDEYYFGRNDNAGIWSQQRNEDMGGFKSTAYYGTTGYGMATGNVYIQLPIPSGLFGVFADAGIFDNGVTLNTAFNTGLAIRMGNIFGLYFPVWMSKELDDSYGNSNYAERIRFTLKFNFLNKPIDLSSFM